MLDEMTLENGRSVVPAASFTRCSSALIASSPRTAYWTLAIAGLRSEATRGRIVQEEWEKNEV